MHEERVLELLKRYVNPGIWHLIRIDAHLERDLLMDSMSKFLMRNELQKMCNGLLPNNEVDNAETVRELVDLYRRYG